MSLTYNLNLKDEHTLVKGCIERDRIYQNQLYNIFAAKMMGVCLRYSKSKEDAEDTLQEGFIQVFTKIKQFKFKGTLEAWLKKIFINCALQRLRKRENTYFFSDVEQLPEVGKLSFFITNNIDLKVLIKYIQDLPPICRLVFNLYVFEGYQHKEIATMLNISEGTSKSNLFDARGKLKQQLKAHDLFFTKTAVNG